MHNGHETKVDYDEGSSQGERIVSYIPEWSCRSNRVRELENLRKQVNDLEIRLRGRHRRRDREDSSDNPDYIADESSQGSGSSWSRDRSCETMGLYHESPHHKRHGYRNATMDAMNRALRRVVQSPFSDEIKCTKMPRWFTRPLFTIYDGKTYPMEHVSHYIQMMWLCYHNNGLMCKVFPSSLRPTSMRWFNGLRKGSIRNFGKSM